MIANGTGQDRQIQMAMRTLTSLCLALGMFILAGPDFSNAQTRVKPVSQARALSLINTLRKKRGLPPLKADARLRQAAQTHSVWMATRSKLTHRAGFGGGLGAKVRRVNYPSSRAWENIAAGQKSLEQAIASWMKSSGHRKNMLSRSAVHLGLAAAHNPKVRYGTYWTLILAEPEK
jgi:uncharacterized protein YkwD